MTPLRRIVLALSALLVACAGAPAGAQPAPAAEAVPAPRRTAAAQESADSGVVRVSGAAEVTVSPDRARVSFAVESEASTAGEASDANAATMQAVLDAVRGGGFPGLELETFGYSLRPVYSSVAEDGRRVQRIEGYRAVNNVAAVIHDPDAVGGVIDAAIEAGANRIAGLSFYASDTRAAREEALRRAVEAATREARVMAGALGRTLGAPLEVQGGAQRPRPQPMGDMAYEEMQMARAPTPIETGDQTVSAQVSITFRLGPAEGR